MESITGTCYTTGVQSVRVAVLLCLTGLPACVSPEGGNRFTRHFSGAVWGAALDQWASDSSQVLPSLFLLGGTAVTRTFDEDVQSDLHKQALLTGGSSDNGDAVLYAMLGLNAAQVTYELFRGDEGRLLQTTVESFLFSQAVTGFLKSTARRRRPEGASTSSFTSGHATASFMSAAMLARHIDSYGDEWYHDLGYLFYIPATYVAMNRVEHNRHHLADVFGGAFLGFTITNIVYNASFGDGKGSPSIFRLGTNTELVPVVEDDGFALLFQHRF